ncbi:MAG: DUF721 domain-containing protein [Actinomycetota bacterium]
MSVPGPRGDEEEPARLRQGLERFLRHLGAPPADVVSELGQRWGEIVGPALDGPTRPIELIDGVLVVACNDPAWASQVTWMEGQIRERFAAIFDGAEVRRVTTRIGS